MKSLLILLLIPFQILAADGGGTQILTAGMLQSGTPAAPNIYQHYLIRSNLQVLNINYIKITLCDVGNIIGDGIDVNNVNGVSIVGNKFHDITGTGIGGGPTSFNNSHFDNNIFGHVTEGIHLLGVWPLTVAQAGLRPTNNTVNNNSFTDWTRYGIEMQICGNGLQINNNFFGSGGNQPISCASGGGINPKTLLPDPAYVDSVGIEIAYNIVTSLPSGGPNNLAVVEIAALGTNVHDNYITGYADSGHWAFCYAINGPTGSIWHLDNNTVVGSSQLAVHEPFGNDNPPTATGNKFYTVANAPTIPKWSADTLIMKGFTSGGGAVIPPPPPVTLTFKAEPQVDGVHISGLPGVAGTLTWVTPSGETKSIPVAAGITSLIDITVPASYVVTYTFTPTGGVASAKVTAQALVNQVPVTPIVIGHSRDSGKTWITDATVQP